MKLNKMLVGAALAVGSAFGAGAQAESVNYGMYYCCSALQQECDFIWGEDSPRCAGVYERCMLSRHCTIP